MTDSAAPVPPADSGRPASRRRRGLLIGLLASLAVNIFLVGWVASSWVYGPRFGPAPRVSGPGMAFQHHRAVRAVSGTDRDAVDRIWRENLPELRNRIRALRASHRDLRAAYTGDRADAAAIAAATAALKDRTNAVFDAVNETMRKIATTLPPEARRAYFDAGFSRARRRDRDSREGEPRRESPRQ